MQGVHELADLAPRDVVAKAITRRMIETGHPHMWLDARHLGERASEASDGDRATREARVSRFWEKPLPDHPGRPAADTAWTPSPT